MNADVNSLVKEAWANRPELKQAALTDSKSAIDLALTKTQKSPTVSVSGDLGYSKNWTSGKSSLDWSAGLQLSVPIADGGLANAQIQAAQTQIEANQVKTAQLSENIAAEVAVNLSSAQSLLERYSLAQEKSSLAAEQYDYTRMRFEGGAVSNQDLLNASVKRDSALADLAKARSDLELAVLKLERSLGR